MKVNGIPFFMTISKQIKFSSAGKLDALDNKTIISHFRGVVGVYAIRGFRVTIILAENQFESMRGDLADLGAVVNIVSRDEHVPEIKRYNRTIKEHIRSTYNVLPFTKVPPVFIIELVYTHVFWHNMFALRGGISKTQSPSELILNQKLDFNAHCKVEFGKYVQTHEEHDNSMATCTVDAIATRPTGNTQGVTTSYASTPAAASTATTGQAFPCPPRSWIRYTDSLDGQKPTDNSPSPICATKILTSYMPGYLMIMTSLPTHTASPQE
jgi:hypothetical protein